MLKKLFIFICGFITMTSSLHAQEVIVAVASNFTEPVKEITEIFQKQTNYKVSLSFGATGTFYTQIKNGAPFEVFLAADDERPTKVMEQGLGVENSQFTYAIGTLVLWSTTPNLVIGADSLNNNAVNHIAYSNPDAAPYGKAAVETMKALNIFDTLNDKNDTLVQGKNISQTFEFVKTGNAEMGFVALSQIINEKEGSQWIVPQNYYSVIKQDAILLKTGENNPAAIAFIKFLKGEEAAKIIEKYGYTIDK